jgi:putative hemolysin
MEDPLPRFLIFVLLVAASAFCSLSGQVLSLSRKTRLRLKPGKSRSTEILENPEPCLFSLRIWNLAFRLCAGFLAASFFPLREAVLPVILLILSFIIFSEVLPGIISAKKPENLLSFVVPAVCILCLPWKPLYLLAFVVCRRRDEASGDAEFRLALEEGEKSGAVESSERSMVEGVLYLGDRPVSAFMTHRSELQWLDINAGPEEAGKKAMEFRAQGFFPVVREVQDDIAGIVSVLDVLAALAGPVIRQGGAGEEKAGSVCGLWKGLQAVMKSPRFIPETMSALKAFEAFGKEDENCLCVMDEYGGFAGLLQIGDLMEEITGGLAGDSPEETLIKQEDGSWLADGGISVDDLAEVLGLENMGKTGGEYHTLAGFILKLAGDIPRAGDSFNWEGYRFQVMGRDGNRIGKVLVSALERGVSGEV